MNMVDCGPNRTGSAVVEWSELVMVITPVNVAPSFRLSVDRHLTEVNVAGVGTEACVAEEIMAGPVPCGPAGGGKGVGPMGEDWAECGQQVCPVCQCRP